MSARASSTTRRSVRSTRALLAAIVLLLLPSHAFADSDEVASSPPEAVEGTLLSSLDALQSHIRGNVELNAEQIEGHKLIFDQYKEYFGSTPAIIQSCLEVVRTYDELEGPLWVARGGFNRRGKPPVNDLHWTIYNVMQNIVDYVYTEDTLASNADLLDGFKFGSSAHFPGSAEPPTDAAVHDTVLINGTNQKPFKHALMHQERPARRPTGAYLAPGSIATLTLPDSIVGRGYQVRVGAHSWDNSRKPRVLRLDRSSIVYPIEQNKIKVASPLGGGIYIEVPPDADSGIVEIGIRNAVRSPFFAATPIHRTSLEEWQRIERRRTAPWADFQTEKFMMQVPTSWIYALDDPVTLMNDWDTAMDAMNELMGLPHLWGRETMYVQVDLQNRASVFAPGYPTVNDRYDPKKHYDGYVNHYLVRGPRFAPDYVFHEQGHAYLFVKFAGEQESTVNLLHVAVLHQKFGLTLDEAFRGSRNFNKNVHRTLDNTAVAWMTSFSFAAKRPMASGEKAYQLKGHAKYVDIARLFGWDVLGDFWRSWVDDLEAGRPWSRHGTDIDTLNLRLSRVAGIDLTPLLHFWGTPPREPGALKAAIAAEGLMRSRQVFDALLHYQSLVPKDNQAFREFAMNWWGKQPSPDGNWTEREHAQQWEQFNEGTSTLIRQAVQDVIDEYFPHGLPEDE